MFYLLSGLSAYLSFFWARRKRAVFHSLALDSVSLLNVILEKQEEDEKIQAVERGTGQLIRSLLTVVLLLASVIVILLIPLCLWALARGEELGDLDLWSWKAVGSISLGATLAFFIPKGREPENGYSELSRLLHRLVLDNPALHERLLKRELKKWPTVPNTERPAFVIVSGLARAGTTSMMESLMSCTSFASLHYGHMPFLLSPRTWAKFQSKNEKDTKKERSHKDGLLIGLTSAEALEEHFFKVKSRDAYILEKELVSYDIDSSDYEEYIGYQSLVLNGSTKRYLSKNNNFLLRYPSVRRLDKDFHLILMIRDPLSHADSLLGMHRSYLKMQAEDGFVLEYMDWLGHHEFGLGHRPFRFPTSSEKISEADALTMDYWLDVWMNFYRYALSLEDEGVSFIPYEHYCQDPESTVKGIRKRLGMSTEALGLAPYRNTRTVTVSYDQKKLEEAMGIYEALMSRALTLGSTGFEEH